MQKPTFRRYGSFLYCFTDHQVIEIDSTLVSEGVIRVSHGFISNGMLPAPVNAVKCSEREFLQLYALAAERLNSCFGLDSVAPIHST
jgi:hypothetical protein